MNVDDKRKEEKKKNIIHMRVSNDAFLSLFSIDTIKLTNTSFFFSALHLQVK